jgi:hypothetical protein
VALLFSNAIILSAKQHSYENTFFSFLIVLLFSACTKSNSDYFLKCTIDGTTKTFNFQSIARRNAGNGFASVEAGGFNRQGSEENIGFIIINQPSANPIVAGTYTDNSSTFEILATYSLGANGPDYEAGATVRENATTSGVTLNRPFSITVTSITNDEVRGRFTGDFYLNGEPQAARKIITDGEFYLKLQ